MEGKQRIATSWRFVAIVYLPGYLIPNRTIFSSLALHALAHSHTSLIVGLNPKTALAAIKYEPIQ